MTGLRLQANYVSDSQSNCLGTSRTSHRRVVLVCSPLVINRVFLPNLIVIFARRCTLCHSKNRGQRPFLLQARSRVRVNPRLQSILQLPSLAADVVHSSWT